MLANIRRRIRDRLAERLRVPSVLACLKQLASVGFTPQGVYDVGAYQGDFAKETLRIWPRTKVTCFEPLPKMKIALDSLALDKNLQIKIESKLLGESSIAEVPFHVGETASSVLEHTEDEQYPTLMLPMTTLDEYANEKSRWPCSLLKLDVQGYELSVLKGGEILLNNEVEVILVELNLLEIYKGAALFHDVVHWLSQQNYVVYDIGGLIRRPIDNALWQVDMVFVKRNGKLRETMKW